MDPRYSGRLSPPRRYAPPGRNSTGRLDTDYESYYQPRVRESPRTSVERIVPRTETRLPPVSRRDDYYVAPRYSETGQGGRRPVSIITPSSSSSRYRPVITSATDIPSSPYGRSRGRDDESFYIQPATSSHNRHFSVGSNEVSRYASDVDRERERPVYKSSGLRQSEYLSPTVPIRDSRDRRDRDYEYEYTTPREQAYHDTTPRTRVRRVSDLGSRDRPTSINGTDEFRRQQGPPVTTRGLAKIEDDGLMRREYRYPRDEAPSRESGSHRGSREERDRTRPSRGLVAVHQEDGYSSNIEGRSQDKSHRHKHRDAADRDRYAEGERREEPIKKHHPTDSEDRRIRHHRTDSEDRRHKSQKYRDDSEERRAPREDRYEREDDGRERRRRHEEPKKDKIDDRKLAEGLAVGAAGVGAAGVIAEGLKHRHDKDTSDVDSETKKSRSRRHRHREEADGERETVNEEGEEDRRERRRRRRREREERELREKEETGGSSNLREEDTRDRHGRPIPVPIPDGRDSQDSRKDSRAEEGGGGERSLRRQGRRRRERTSSSDTESSDSSRSGDNKDRSMVRVVSPARDSSRKPKGILRPPTQKFPEDPAPIREGVAPLKDAGKKGVPANARWTKIDRRLVNPDALELANERYEERPDAVIVLRVLSKEEIEKLAAITQELRSRRSAGRSTEEQPRMIEGGRDRENSSDSDRPKQIAAQAYSDANDGHRGSIPDQPIHTEEDDRPSLQKEPSYQRFAPPGVQPQNSIPTYPPIPGRSPVAGSQAGNSSAPPVSHDPSYPSQGGGYKPAQA